MFHATQISLIYRSIVFVYSSSFTSIFHERVLKNRCESVNANHFIFISDMPSSIWTLKSLVLFLNAGKRKKKENSLLNSSRKTTKSLLRRNRKSDENSFDEIVLTDEIWSMVIDNLNPLEILKLRRVNRQLNNVVSTKLNSLIYFDVLRCESAAELIDNNPESRQFSIAINSFFNFRPKNSLNFTS